MNLSKDGLEVLKQLEGFSAKPYWDHKQWSIGYGSFAGSYKQAVKPRITVTKQEATTMLLKQVVAYENSVRSAAKVPLNQSQFDSLVLFTYNLGTGILTAASKTYGDTLADDLNAGNLTRLKERMLLYVNASGKKVTALVKRRNIEVAMFEKGIEFIKSNGGAFGLSLLIFAAFFFNS